MRASVILQRKAR